MLEIFPKYLNFENILKKCIRVPGPLVIKLNKMSKKDFFDSLDIKNNSKPVWSKCKPYLSNTHSKGDSFLLKNKKVADVFNSVLSNIY